MAEGDPWEIELLKTYCGTDVSLESLSFARKSVLASAWYIARRSPSAHPDVCLCGGERVEGQCAVRQWVEFYVARIRTATVWDALSRDQLQAVLQELNCYLSSRIFMVNDKLSLADILLYYGLHRYLAGMSFLQKAEYVHLCRWFDHVQHFPSVRPFSMPVIVFHKNPDLLKL